VNVFWHEHECGQTPVVTVAGSVDRSGQEIAAVVVVEQR
jgi:hypothetical protein